MERSTLSEYPIQITSNGVDLASLLDPESYASAVSGETSASSDSSLEGMVTVRRLLSQLTENTTNVNDLSAAGLSGK